MVELDDADARILEQFLDGPGRSDTDIDQGDLAIERVQYGIQSTDDGIAVTVEECRDSLRRTSCGSTFRGDDESLRTAAGAE